MNPEPIVLIPGLLCTPRLFADQLPSLWRSGSVTVASHHQSDDLAVLADQILAAAPPRFALAGLSMGGYLAFEIMRQAGHRVTRLALLNTSARPDTASQAQRRVDQIAMVAQGEFDSVTDALYRRWVRPARHDDLALRRVILQMASETGPRAFVRQQTAIMNRPSSLPGLAEISCPVLVVAGADDEVTVPERAAEIAAHIPRARLVVIPDCGHLSTLEQPAAVTSALADWLALRMARRLHDLLASRPRAPRAPALARSHARTPASATTASATTASATTGTRNPIYRLISGGIRIPVALAQYRQLRTF